MRNRILVHIYHRVLPSLFLIMLIGVFVHGASVLTSLGHQTSESVLARRQASILVIRKEAARLGLRVNELLAPVR